MSGGGDITSNKCSSFKLLTMKVTLLSWIKNIQADFYLVHVVLIIIIKPGIHTCILVAYDRILHL